MVSVSVSKHNVTRRKCVAVWIDRKSYALELLYTKKSARELATIRKRESREISKTKASIKL